MKSTPCVASNARPPKRKRNAPPPPWGCSSPSLRHQLRVIPDGPQCEATGAPPMDWKNRRIDALLEQALIEDKAASDTTTNLTIDPELRATATILARQEMVVAGLGCVPRFFEIFSHLDKRA